MANRMRRGGVVCANGWYDFGGASIVVQPLSAEALAHSAS